MTEIAPGIEEAMRRVAALSDTAETGAANVLSGSRRAIVEALREAAEPLTVEELAEHTGLHANTARHHLDVLAAANLIERTAAAPSGRGRPKILYSVAPAALAPFSDLSEFLQRALDGGNEDVVAVEAARRWLAAVPQAGLVDSADGAVAAAVESLEAVGFTARSDAIGDTIVVTDCPYASLISEHPMICTVHAELVSGVLARTGQDVTLAGFDVWVRPGVCRARLTRQDTDPAFVAEPVAAPNPLEESA
jgi:predicted ArsR family transcriptional regulator